MRSGYRQFYEKYFIKEGALYKRLYEEGQSPKTLIIACSDSRVAPEVIFSSAPGELFVVRNIANIVPPLASAGLNTGTAAAIEYAVEHLHVRNIVVMGHEACGGINALMASAEDSHGGAIADWIHIAAPAKDRTLKLKAATPQLAQTLCEKESVKNSVENLMTFPFVSEKVERGELRLYGWHFSIEKGTVEEVCAK